VNKTHALPFRLDPCGECALRLRLVRRDTNAQACRAFVDAGCCASSFLEMLPIYMKLMCVKSASKIAPILHMLPMFCALPFGAGAALAPKCPGFNPGPYAKLAPKTCPDHNVFRCDA
jgi:hypothetical protein